MQMKLVSFGEIDIENRHYAHDVVIEQGRVRKRQKKLSKVYRERFGHTPLSIREDIPWHAGKLFIGTGAYGSLPILADVFDEAERRGVDVVARPTSEVCELLKDYPGTEINAILHVTC